MKIATVTAISLGYTALRETGEDEIIVPNSLMGSSAIVRLGAADVAPPDTH